MVRYDACCWKYCPTLVSKKRIWGAEELGYLGLGSMLYLNFMRWMAALFFLVGVFSIPNAYYNSLGLRYTLDTMEAIEYAATHASIANLGGPSWTIAGNDYCNNHGFFTEVCAHGGWNPSNPDGTDPSITTTVSTTTSAWDYSCGDAPDNITTTERSLTRYIFGGIDIRCTKRINMCACMPGWTGERCNEPDNSTILINNTGTSPVNGYCLPPQPWWWLSTDRVERIDNAKISQSVRDNQVCNGHGACIARPDYTDITQVSYTFCQCDKGYYGEFCQYTSSPQDVHGDFYGYAHTQKDKELCEAGLLPSISRQFIAVTFPSAECGIHGFGKRFDLTVDGRMNYSNAYRVQTPAVCFCEPGFNGEECLGGEPVPDSQGWFASVSSILLLVGCALLYRHRKKMEQVYDDTHVTPGDFTIFVNNLPTIKVDQIGEVQAHFEQFGPIHFISPATDDETLVNLQREKNAVLMKLQIKQECDLYDRQVEAAKRSKLFAASRGHHGHVHIPRGDIATVTDTTTVSPTLSTDPQHSRDLAWSLADNRTQSKLNASRPDPASVAPVSVLVGDAADTARKARFRLWARLLMNIPFLSNIVITRRFLFQYLMDLNDRIVREMHEKHVHEFNRCFVTFEYSSDMDDVIDVYALRREGIFGRRKPFGRSVPFRNSRTKEEKTINMLFRGKKISVEQASEPGEVMWDSLDVGPRMRSFRMFIVFLFMVAFLCAAYAIVITLNAEKQGGIIGILIAIGVLALNALAAQTWIVFADVEQHYKAGAKMRSIFWKTLITQICITLLAGTLGVYGYPLDAKNGYIQDWYKEAGGFVFRMILIESVVPPLINLTNIPYRISTFLAYFAKSKTEYNIAHIPPSYILAERCAALMRTILLCCAFNAGLPVLNFAVAVGLFIRYWSDLYCMKNIFRMQRAGAELPRALELCLILATAVNIVMNWVTLRVGWETNLVTEVIFYIGVITTMWAILGYFSYKKFRGRDCWGGSGPVIPCVSWLCCFNERILAPFTRIHEMFMRSIFGQFFFNDYEDNIDETGGKSYSQLRPRHRLRNIPYYQKERAQIFPEFDSNEPVLPPITGEQYLAILNSNEKVKDVEGDTVLHIEENPMLLKQKEENLKQIALNRKLQAMEAMEEELAASGSSTNQFSPNSKLLNPKFVDEQMQLVNESRKNDLAKGESSKALTTSKPPKFVIPVIPRFIQKVDTNNPPPKVNTKV